MRAISLRVSVAVLLTALCVTALGAEVPAVPEVRIPRCAEAPKIDGQLTDACWTGAARLDRFFLRGRAAERSDAVSARLMADTEWLYVAFEVRHPQPAAIRCSAVDHDGNVGADDSVEIFLDGGTGDEPYYHFLLNAMNVRAEWRGLKTGHERKGRWDTPWRSATRITEKGWQAEIAIPLITLTWRGDLARTSINLVATRILPKGAGGDGRADTVLEMAGWSQVKLDSHEPARFGRAKGLEEMKPKGPFLVRAESIKVSDYMPGAQGGFCYEVTGQVRSYHAAPGKVQLIVEDSPLSGQGAAIRHEMAFAKKDTAPVKLVVPVGRPADRSITLHVRDGASGETLQTVSLRDTAHLSPMRAYSRLSYFTTEPNAEIICDIGLPESVRTALVLTAKGSDGTEVARVEGPQAVATLSVPIERRPPGETQVIVELVGKDGVRIAHREVALMKRAPKPGHEWKIDRLRLTVLNNGKPFFPFGIMNHVPLIREEEDAVKDLADMGFDLVARFKSQPVNRSGELYQMAEKYGFYVLEFPFVVRWGVFPAALRAGTQRNRLTLEQFQQFKDQEMLKTVEKFVNEPRLVGWILWDEPRTEQNAEFLQLYHDDVYRLDGYHPTQIDYPPPVPTGDKFTRNCDIINNAAYMIPGYFEASRSTPNRIAKYAYLLSQRGWRDRKVPWMTLLADSFSATALRILSKEEQYVQTYLALINGVKGIIYWRYPFNHQETYLAMRELGEQMKVLGPACIGEEIPQAVISTPVPYDPGADSWPDVQAALKPHPERGCILLVANWRPYPVDVTFSMPALGERSEIRPLFGGGEALVAEKGVFRDRFEPMSTRAYHLALTPPKETVQITLAQQAYPEQANPFYTPEGWPPIKETPGRKNVLRNSGFETCSFPGMPDWYCLNDFMTAGQPSGYRINDHRDKRILVLDENNPYEGRHSMRLQGDNARMMWRERLQLDKPTKFVLSAYVRGDCDKASISFATEKGPSDPIPVTTQWRRIHRVVTLQPEPQPAGHLFGFQLPRSHEKDHAHTVWIDAMQLERGEEPTAYEPQP